MKRAKEIESLAKRTQFEPDASADQRILSAAEAALDRRMDVSRAGQGTPDRENDHEEYDSKTGNRRGGGRGRAAGNPFLRGTSGTSWAAVLERVNGFDTCVYRSREVETTGPRLNGFEFATENESKNYRSEIYGTFSENYKNGKLSVRHYMLLQEGQHISIGGYDSEHKLCLRTAVTDRSLREFHDGDPRRMIAKILAGNYVEIGEDTIEGRASGASSCEIRTSSPLKVRRFPRWTISLRGSGSRSRQDYRCGWNSVLCPRIRHSGPR